jgi:hypothetical protein
MKPGTPVSLKSPLTGEPIFGVVQLPLFEGQTLLSTSHGTVNLHEDEGDFKLYGLKEIDEGHVLYDAAYYDKATEVVRVFDALKCAR